ncbi:MAG: hypothetical protein MOB07_01200 [Acidobacteria bacterium]|nr:hypothetical protein [Acidobacteriota bacterium]
MTIEEITQTLQTVAENQAKHAEMHSRHSADIAEIDRMLEMSLRSQNRHDERLAVVSEIMHTLADKQIKNEELFAENEKRFAELAEAQRRAEFRMEKLEGYYKLLESFVRDFRNETRDHFAETDKRLAEFINETNRRAALADKRQARTDEQIKALILSQTRTDEVVRSLIERNGEPAARTKKTAKKTAKKVKKAGKKD